MSRPVGTTKQYCRRGHDTYAAGGRTRNGCCAPCHKIRNTSRTKVASGEWVSADPIRRLGTRPQLVAAWVSYRGCSERQALREVARLYAVRSLTIFEADEWCCALGTHLAIVFPSLYQDAKATA